MQAYPAPHPAAVCFRVLNGETCVGEELRLPLTSLKGVDSIFGCSLAAGAPGLRTLAAASGAAVGSHWARKYVVSGSSITAGTGAPRYVTDTAQLPLPPPLPLPGVSLRCCWPGHQMCPLCSQSWAAPMAWWLWPRWWLLARMCLVHCGKSLARHEGEPRLLSTACVLAFCGSSHRCSTACLPHCRSNSPLACYV